MITLLEILKEEIELVPRRSSEERDKKYAIILNKKIEQYIKNGSKGDLDLSGSTVKKLPEELKMVGRDLILTYSAITELPDDLKIGRDLDINNTENIKKLSNNLKIGRDLSAAESKLESLPDDLKIKGDLFIRDTPISKLPKGLIVGGNLHAYNTQITELPEDLKTRDLIISKNLLKKYKSIKNLRQKLPGVRGEIFSI